MFVIPVHCTALDSDGPICSNYCTSIYQRTMIDSFWVNASSSNHVGCKQKTAGKFSTFYLREVGTLLSYLYGEFLSV